MRVKPLKTFNLRLAIKIINSKVIIKKIRIKYRKDTNNPEKFKLNGFIKRIFHFIIEVF